MNDSKHRQLAWCIGTIGFAAVVAGFLLATYWSLADPVNEPPRQPPTIQEPILIEPEVSGPR